jgi:hypothetical protein
MLTAPDPLTSSFLVGLACGIGLTLIVLTARAKFRRMRLDLRPAGFVSVSPDIDVELRRRSAVAAKAVGEPSSAPFIYSAVRDLAATTNRRGRLFRSATWRAE